MGSSTITFQSINSNLTMDTC